MTTSTNDTKLSLLEQMLAQFQARHGRLPGKILATPAALMTLAIRREALPPRINGVPLECHAFAATNAANATMGEQPVALGVFLRPDKESLASVDIF